MNYLVLFCALFSLKFFLIGAGGSAAAASQFFTVGQDSNGVWWFQRAGQRFLPKSVVCVNVYANGVNESGVDAYMDHVKKEFHGNVSQWYVQQWSRLDQLGFNSFGAWTYDLNVFQSLGFRMPYVIELGLGKTAADWWDPQWVKNATAKAKTRLTAAVVRDPLLIGITTDNEMTWGGRADRWPVVWRESDQLLLKYLLLPDAAPGRQQATSFLSRQYANNVTAFAHAWYLDSIPASFNSYRPHLPFVWPPPSSRKRADYTEFLKLAAHQYFKTATAIVRNFDRNHLLLGVRYSWWEMPDAVLEAQREGDYYDVTSYNGYEWYPGFSIQDEVKHLYSLTGKPVFITEFSFKAMDSGYLNINGAGYPLLTQEDRAQSFTRYIQQLMSMKVSLGYSWWRWVDPPKEPGAQSNFGVLTQNNSFWEILAAAMTKINPTAEKIHSNAKF